MCVDFIVLLEAFAPWWLRSDLHRYLFYVKCYLISPCRAACPESMSSKHGELPQPKIQQLPKLAAQDWCIAWSRMLKRKG